MLPLVVFAVFFGFAATRLNAQMRESLVTFFRAVSETMIVIVQWVLLAGPIGVFALSLGVGAAHGVPAPPARSLITSSSSPARWR